LSKLTIGVVDLVTKAPTRSLYARVMHANLASIMPQVVSVWCEEEGHDVNFVCFTGLENLTEELPEKVDILFICGFTEAAQLAYSVSNLFRSRGVITVLGGPHARCYPDDALKYFDYVVGFTDKNVIRDILQDCSPHRPIGQYLTAPKQPLTLPSVRERWKFIESTIRKSPLLKVVPMIGSLGCPYTCAFCIDADVPYQPLEFEELKEDLRFLKEKLGRPVVGWHDPNFGVRFNDYMDAIEEALPNGGVEFIAESSLSILSEPHLKRLRDNNFKAILPGIESWYGMGNKSGTGRSTGMDKVERVAEHVNTILHYIPYVQTNFVVGLDCDEGDEPFELTKRFIDLTPGAFPGYSLLSAFGQASVLNLDYQREGRVLSFPHHFLDNFQAMNVRPKNYTWPEFYDRLIGLTSYSFSKRSIARRFKANMKAGAISQWMNVIRAVSSEGSGRTKYHREVRRRFDHDPEFRPYFNQESPKIPSFYLDRVRKDLGAMYQWLPEGGIEHDSNAYLEKSTPKELPDRAVAAS